MKLRDFKPKHFLWSVQDRVATVTLNRPEKKNPLTFESYAELRDTFLALRGDPDIKAVVITGAGGNFCSGGDVHEIIGQLVKMPKAELLKFTTMTGDLIKAIMTAPQPVISAIDGVCVGAGACIAMSSDLRFATTRSKVAFLFIKVGLAGCDMGACSILPRLIGHSRAAELLYSGRSMDAEEASRIGFYNRVYDAQELMAATNTFARELADGPSLAHSITKKMLRLEWEMPVIEAIQAEAVAQAECMESGDFKRAYEAIVGKRKAVFEGN